MNVDSLKLLGLGKCREITDIPTVAHGELEQCFGDGSFNQVQAIEKVQLCQRQLAQQRKMQLVGVNQNETIKWDSNARRISRADQQAVWVGAQQVLQCD